MTEHLPDEKQNSEVRIGKDKNNPEFEPFTLPEHCDKLWGLKMDILTGKKIND